MKKAFSVILSLILIMTFSISSLAASKVAATKKKVVTFSVVIDQEKNTPGWQAVLKNVESNSKSLGYKFEQQVMAGAQTETAMKARFASGDMPDFMFVNSAGRACDLYNAKNFVDISGTWTKNFDAGILKSAVYSNGGKLIVQPIGSINPGSMYYNKKVFAKAGVSVPKNWTELLNVCQKIKAKGIVPFFISGKDAWSIQILSICAFQQEFAGKETKQAELYNTNKLKFAGSAKFKDGLAKYKELITKGYANKTFVSDSYDMAKKAIADGTAAMYPMGAWVNSDFIKLFPDKVNDIGCFPLNIYGKDVPTVWTSYGITLTKGCKNPTLAKQAINYIGSKEIQSIYFAAEPGIPLAKGVTIKGLYPFQQDIVNANNKLGGSTLQVFLLKYWSANAQNYMMDYLVGAKTVDECLKAMDLDNEKSAKAKNDPNWK